MLSLKFRLTLDEQVEASCFLRYRSPTIRRHTTITYAVLSTIYFLCGILIGSRNSSDPVIVITAGILFVVVPLTPLWWFSRWLTARSVRRMLMESSNSALLGDREAVIDELELTVKNNQGEGKIVWTGIERVVESKDFVFFYLTPMLAHVFPKQNSISGDPKEFVEAAKEYWLAANPGKVVEEYQ